MSFWDNVIFDPVELLRAKPWWYKVLIFLPWLFLIGAAGIIWFLMPGKKTADYIEKTKNNPYEKLDEVFNKNIIELNKIKAEFHEKTVKKAEEIERDARIFEKTRAAINQESHEELIRRLERGK